MGVTETGDEESIVRYGWGTRNREGQDLVEMVMRKEWLWLALSSIKETVTK